MRFPDSAKKLDFDSDYMWHESSVIQFIFLVDLPSRGRLLFEFGFQNLKSGCWNKGPRDDKHTATRV